MLNLKANRYGSIISKRIPVSYTHLDVYKRQREYRNNLAASFTKADNGEQVLIRRKNEIYAQKSKNVIYGKETYVG